MLKIKECPGCGRSDCQVKDLFHYDFHVVCDRCKMQGPYSPQVDESIKLWNALPRKSDIEQLEREADWLAHEVCIYEIMWLDSADECGNKPRSVQHWRKEARKAVKKMENNGNKN